MHSNFLHNNFRTLDSTVLDSKPLDSIPVDFAPLDSEIHEPISNREPLRVLVIGSRKGVMGTIHTLHRLGFAEVREWSPLLPAPNAGEVMSILMRYVVIH